MHDSDVEGIAGCLAALIILGLKAIGLVVAVWIVKTAWTHF